MQRAARAYGYTYENLSALRYVARHPQELIRHPQWLRQRKMVTIALRVPWWPYDAVTWMATSLPRQARVFEYGGGGSTLWLEDLGATVIAVEHDEHWHARLVGKIRPTTRLLFRPAEASGAVTSTAAPGYFDTYVAAIDVEPDGSFDLVVVDGRARVECARHAMPKLKPGGLLLLDDTDRTRYRPAIEMLGAWEHRIFTGLKPGERAPAQTSVWRRPA
jgi:Methyltransferase domain